MSAVDIESITDESQLRQMWKEEEDPTEKRKIRSRMYKMREQRLKDLHGLQESTGQYARSSRIETEKKTIEVRQEHEIRSSQRTTSSTSSTQRVITRADSGSPRSGGSGDPDRCQKNGDRFRRSKSPPKTFSSRSSTAAEAPSRPSGEAQEQSSPSSKQRRATPNVESLSSRMTRQSRSVLGCSPARKQRIDIAKNPGDAHIKIGDGQIVIDFSPDKLSKARRQVVLEYDGDQPDVKEIQSKLQELGLDALENIDIMLTGHGSSGSGSAREHGVSGTSQRQHRTTVREFSSQNEEPVEVITKEIISDADVEVGDGEVIVTIEPDHPEKSTQMVWTFSGTEKPNCEVLREKLQTFTFDDISRMDDILSEFSGRVLEDLEESHEDENGRTIVRRRKVMLCGEEVKTPPPPKPRRPLKQEMVIAGSEVSIWTPQTTIMDARRFILHYPGVPDVDQILCILENSGPDGLLEMFEDLGCDVLESEELAIDGEPVKTYRVEMVKDSCSAPNEPCRGPEIRLTDGNINIHLKPSLEDDTAREFVIQYEGSRPDTQSIFDRLWSIDNITLNAVESIISQIPGNIMEDETNEEITETGQKVIQRRRVIREVQNERSRTTPSAHEIKDGDSCSKGSTGIDMKFSGRNLMIVLNRNGKSEKEVTITIEGDDSELSEIKSQLKRHDLFSDAQIRFILSQVNHHFESPGRGKSSSIGKSKSPKILSSTKSSTSTSKVSELTKKFGAYKTQSSPRSPSTPIVHRTPGSNRERSISNSSKSESPRQRRDVDDTKRYQSGSKNTPTGPRKAARDHDTKGSSARSVYKTSTDTRINDNNFIIRSDEDHDKIGKPIVDYDGVRPDVIKTHTRIDSVRLNEVGELDRIVSAVEGEVIEDTLEEHIETNGSKMVVMNKIFQTSELDDTKRSKVTRIEPVRVSKRDNEIDQSTDSSGSSYSPSPKHVATPQQSLELPEGVDVVLDENGLQLTVKPDHSARSQHHVEVTYHGAAPDVPQVECILEKVRCQDWSGLDDVLVGMGAVLQEESDEEIENEHGNRFLRRRRVFCANTKQTINGSSASVIDLLEGSISQHSRHCHNPTPRSVQTQNSKGMTSREDSIESGRAKDGNRDLSSDDGHPSDFVAAGYGSAKQTDHDNVKQSVKLTPASLKLESDGLNKFDGKTTEIKPSEDSNKCDNTVVDDIENKTSTRRRSSTHKPTSTKVAKEISKTPVSGSSSTRSTGFDDKCQAERKSPRKTTDGRLKTDSSKDDTYQCRRDQRRRSSSLKTVDADKAGRRRHQQTDHEGNHISEDKSSIIAGVCKSQTPRRSVDSTERVVGTGSLGRRRSSDSKSPSKSRQGSVDLGECTRKHQHGPGGTCQRKAALDTGLAELRKRRSSKNLPLPSTQSESNEDLDARKNDDASEVRKDGKHYPLDNVDGKGKENNRQNFDTNKDNLSATESATDDFIFYSSKESSPERMPERNEFLSQKDSSQLFQKFPTDQPDFSGPVSDRMKGLQASAHSAEICTEYEPAIASVLNKKSLFENKIQASVKPLKKSPDSPRVPRKATLWDSPVDLDSKKPKVQRRISPIAHVAAKKTLFDRPSGSPDVECEITRLYRHRDNRPSEQANDKTTSDGQNIERPTDIASGPSKDIGATYNRVANDVETATDGKQDFVENVTPSDTSLERHMGSKGSPAVSKHSPTKTTRGVSINSVNERQTSTPSLRSLGIRNQSKPDPVVKACAGDPKPKEAVKSNDKLAKHTVPSPRSKSTRDSTAFVRSPSKGNNRLLRVTTSGDTVVDKSTPSKVEQNRVHQTHRSNTSPSSRVAINSRTPGDSSLHSTRQVRRRPSDEPGSPVRKATPNDTLQSKRTPKTSGVKSLVSVEHKSSMAKTPVKRTGSDSEKKHLTEPSRYTRSANNSNGKFERKPSNKLQNRKNTQCTIDKQSENTSSNRKLRIRTASKEGREKDTKNNENNAQTTSLSIAKMSRTISAEVCETVDPPVPEVQSQKNYPQENISPYKDDQNNVFIEIIDKQSSNGSKHSPSQSPVLKVAPKKTPASGLLDKLTFIKSLDDKQDVKSGTASKLVNIRQGSSSPVYQKSSSQDEDVSSPVSDEDTTTFRRSGSFRSGKLVQAFEKFENGSFEKSSPKDGKSRRAFALNRRDSINRARDKFENLAQQSTEPSELERMPGQESVTVMRVSTTLDQAAYFEKPHGRHDCSASEPKLDKSPIDPQINKAIGALLSRFETSPEKSAETLGKQSFSDVTCALKQGKLPYVDSDGVESSVGDQGRKTVAETRKLNKENSNRSLVSSRESSPTKMPDEATEEGQLSTQLDNDDPDIEPISAKLVAQVSRESKGSRRASDTLSGLDIYMKISSPSHSLVERETLIELPKTSGKTTSDQLPSLATSNAVSAAQVMAKTDQPILEIQSSQNNENGSEWLKTFRAPSLESVSVAAATDKASNQKDSESSGIETNIEHDQHQETDVLFLLSPKAKSSLEEPHVKVIEQSLISGDQLHSTNYADDVDSRSRSRPVPIDIHENIAQAKKQESPSLLPGNDSIIQCSQEADLCIEEIEDLELLDTMLLAAKDYDKRSRIRGRVRILKRRKLSPTKQSPLKVDQSIMSNRTSLPKTTEPAKKNDSPSNSVDRRSSRGSPGKDEPLNQRRYSRKSSTVIFPDFKCVSRRSSKEETTPQDTSIRKSREEAMSFQDMDQLEDRPRQSDTNERVIRRSSRGEATLPIVQEPGVKETVPSKTREIQLEYVTRMFHSCDPLDRPKIEELRGSSSKIELELPESSPGLQDSVVGKDYIKQDDVETNKFANFHVVKELSQEHGGRNDPKQIDELGLMSSSDGGSLCVSQQRTNRVEREIPITITKADSHTPVEQAIVSEDVSVKFEQIDNSQSLESHEEIIEYSEEVCYTSSIGDQTSEILLETVEQDEIKTITDQTARSGKGQHEESESLDVVEETEYTLEVSSSYSPSATFEDIQSYMSGVIDKSLVDDVNSFLPTESPGENNSIPKLKNTNLSYSRDPATAEEVTLLSDEFDQAQLNREEVSFVSFEAEQLSPVLAQTGKVYGLVEEPSVVSSERYSSTKFSGAISTHDETEEKHIPVISHEPAEANENVAEPSDVSQKGKEYDLPRVREPEWLKRSSTPREKTPCNKTEATISSYGPGPTDDHGRPLFGLRALRRQHPPQQQQHQLDNSPASEKNSGGVQTTPKGSDGGKRNPQMLMEPPASSDSATRSDMSSQRFDSDKQLPLFGGLRALRSRHKPDVNLCVSRDEEEERAGSDVEEIEAIAREQERLLSASTEGTATTSYNDRQTPVKGKSPAAAESEAVSQRGRCSMIPRPQSSQQRAVGVSPPCTTRIHMVMSSPTEEPSGESLPHNTANYRTELTRLETLPAESSSGPIFHLESDTATYTAFTTEHSTGSATIEERKPAGILKKPSQLTPASTVTSLLDDVTDDVLRDISDLEDNGDDDEHEVEPEPEGSTLLLTKSPLVQRRAGRLSRRTAVGSDSDNKQLTDSDPDSAEELSNSGRKSVSDGYDGVENKNNSFLQNRDKVSGIRDVLDRMQDPQSEPSSPDDRARSLLNKFIGAQVMMTGIESMMNQASTPPTQHSIGGSSSQVTRLSHSQLESSISVSVPGDRCDGRSTASPANDAQTVLRLLCLALKRGRNALNSAVQQYFTCRDLSRQNPGTVDPLVICGVDINKVNDQQKLKQLLERCDIFEDRRKIRARIMALVQEPRSGRRDMESDVEYQQRRDGGSVSVQGELCCGDTAGGDSRLLPLVYDQLRSSLRQQQQLRSVATQRRRSGGDAGGTTGGIDSGTESGEDGHQASSASGGELNLFLSGLRWSLNGAEGSDGGSTTQKFSRQLVGEVLGVLGKLRSSLTESDGGMSQGGADGASSGSAQLLMLIDRLQSSLKVGAVEEEASNGSRGSRRRTRRAHTVGITRDELSQMRRSMEVPATHQSVPTPVVAHSDVAAVTGVIDLKRVRSPAAVVHQLPPVPSSGFSGAKPFNRQLSEDYQHRKRSIPNLHRFSPQMKQFIQPPEAPVVVNNPVKNSFSDMNSSQMAEIDADTDTAGMPQVGAHTVGGDEENSVTIKASLPDNEVKSAASSDTVTSGEIKRDRFGNASNVSDSKVTVIDRQALKATDQDAAVSTEASVSANGSLRVADDRCMNNVVLNGIGGSTLDASSSSNGKCILRASMVDSELNFPSKGQMMTKHREELSDVSILQSNENNLNNIYHSIQNGAENAVLESAGSVNSKLEVGANESIVPTNYSSARREYVPILNNDVAACVSSRPGSSQSLAGRTDPPPLVSGGHLPWTRQRRSSEMSFNMLRRANAFEGQQQQQEPQPVWTRQERLKKTKSVCSPSPPPGRLLPLYQQPAVDNKQQSPAAASTTPMPLSQTNATPVVRAALSVDSQNIEANLIGKSPSSAFAPVRKREPVAVISKTSVEELSHLNGFVSRAGPPSENGVPVANQEHGSFRQTLKSKSPVMRVVLPSSGQPCKMPLNVTSAGSAAMSGRVVQRAATVSGGLDHIPGRPTPLLTSPVASASAPVPSDSSPALSLSRRMSQPNDTLMLLARSTQNAVVKFRQEQGGSDLLPKQPDPRAYRPPPLPRTLFSGGGGEASSAGSGVTALPPQYPRIPAPSPSRHGRSGASGPLQRSFSSDVLRVGSAAMKPFEARLDSDSAEQKQRTVMSFLRDRDADKLAQSFDEVLEKAVRSPSSMFAADKEIPECGARNTVAVGSQSPTDQPQQPAVPLMSMKHQLTKSSSVGELHPGMRPSSSRGVFALRQRVWENGAAAPGGLPPALAQQAKMIGKWFNENFQQSSGRASAAESRTVASSSVSTSSLAGMSSAARKPQFSKGQQSVSTSAFDKFRQMDSATSGSKPIPRNSSSSSDMGFKIDGGLASKAQGAKDMMLYWCQCRLRQYKDVNVDNFSTSWNDGMAFCALIHHFYPDAFDFDSLNPKNRRENFHLAFSMADKLAGIYPLLDVDDMVRMKKPDWKCVFTYVQAIYNRLKDGP